MNLGSLYEKQGKRAEAIAEFELFLKDWKGSPGTAEAVHQSIERLKRR